jgi:hypothetical protein
LFDQAMSRSAVRPAGALGPAGTAARRQLGVSPPDIVDILRLEEQVEHALALNLLEAAAGHLLARVVEAHRAPVPVGHHHERRHDRQHLGDEIALGEQVRVGVFANVHLRGQLRRAFGHALRERPREPAQLRLEVFQLRHFGEGHDHLRSGGWGPVRGDAPQVPVAVFAAEFLLASGKLADHGRPRRRAV